MTMFYQIPREIEARQRQVGPRANPPRQIGNRPYMVLNLQEYTPAMKRYLQEFKDLNLKNNSYRIMNLNIPDSEIKKVSCPISRGIADTPVLLGGRLYDLTSLLGLPSDNIGARLDPFLNNKFFLRDIQPALETQSQIERVITLYNKKIIEKADKKATLALDLCKKKNFSDAKKYFIDTIESYEKLEVRNDRLASFHYNERGQMSKCKLGKAKVIVF